MKGSVQMVTTYKLFRIFVRKLIELLTNVWLWAIKKEQAAEERKRYGR